jgi:HlyD family secretion protein
MDIARPDLAEAKRRRRLMWSAGGVILFAIAAFGLSRLEPAAPGVDAGTVWIETVKRGPMVREVRGTGTLVPEEIRWIPAVTAGRVEAILAQPGREVTADTVILDLNDPQQVQAGLDAALRSRAADAELRSLEARLESQNLEQQSMLGRTRSEYEQARLRANADEELARQGLVANINRQISRKAADELEKRVEFEERRLAALESSIAAQLASQSAAVEQVRAIEKLQRDRTDSLRVRAGIDGVLQQVAVEVGQQVTPGTILAKVVQPAKLKAQLRIAETQARDVQPGLPAVIDTRNGKVPGTVSRVDPAAQGGTVTVDVAIEGELPRGARPDMTVDGTIELERLDDVLFVGRPVHAAEDATIGLFRVGADGVARRVQVGIGRTSVSTIEVRSGLEEGDRVILSDMSAWDEYERLQLD